MLVLTASAETTRPHGLHSNVCIGGKSAWATVRANCIVSPQHGQATYSLYSRIRLSPIHEAAGPVGTELPRCCTVGRFWPIGGKPGSHHSTCLTARCGHRPAPHIVRHVGRTQQQIISTTRRI